MCVCVTECVLESVSLHVCSHFLSSVVKCNQTVLSYAYADVSEITTTQHADADPPQPQQPVPQRHVINRQRKWHCW